VRYRVTQDCFYENSYLEKGAVVEIPKGAPVYDYMEPVRGAVPAREPKAASDGDDGQTPRDLLNDQLGVGAQKPWETPPPETNKD